MGRVSKYKKVKSCDPYSSQNGGKQSMTGVWGMDDNGRRLKKRSKTSIALRKKRKRPISTDNPFDVPPNGGDEFDLNDLLAVKKMKPVQELLDEEPKKMERTKVTSVPATKQRNGSDSEGDNDANNKIALDHMLEEKQAARILKIGDPSTAAAKKKHAPKLERLPGESRKAFQKRTKTETRQLIRNEALTQRNAEKRQRKKEFLNRKKKAKRGKSDSNSFESDDDEHYLTAKHQSASSPNNDGFITGEQAVARAALGDQVERPPVFDQLPRGAKAKLPSKKKNGSVSVAAEQQAMENMRRKVQAQYELIKLKRRRKGDFHL